MHAVEVLKEGIVYEIVSLLRPDEGLCGQSGMKPVVMWATMGVSVVATMGLLE